MQSWKFDTLQTHYISFQQTGMKHTGEERCFNDRYKINISHHQNMGRWIENTDALSHVNCEEMNRANGLQTIEATVHFKAIGPTVKAQNLLVCWKLVWV